eukprot:scaffold2549_cov108-Isochrysis_galbana.AAC.6
MAHRPPAGDADTRAISRSSDAASPPLCHTSYRRCGRSSSPSSTVTLSGASPRQLSNGARRAGGSVAVSSSHGTPGSSERSVPSRAYSGRKSEPHVRMQCASSTTTRCSRPRLANPRSRLASTGDCTRRSGVTKRSFGAEVPLGGPTAR